MSKNNQNLIGIIGGGLGGLASACTLAARGYKVVLFETNPWLGGKAAELNEQGFRFDMGPTIITKPDVLDLLFSDVGKRREDYLNLVALDPQWRAFFSDGSKIDLYNSLVAMTAGPSLRHSAVR